MSGDISGVSGDGNRDPSAHIAQLERDNARLRRVLRRFAPQVDGLMPFVIEATGDTWFTAAELRDLANAIDYEPLRDLTPVEIINLLDAQAGYEVERGGFENKVRQYRVVPASP